MSRTNYKYYYALAVERVRGKSDAKDALAGITIAQQLQELIPNDQDKEYFERIVTWWVQPHNVAGRPLSSLSFFAVHKPVFSTLDIHDRQERIPNRFLGFQFLIALKPALYDMDLKTFAQASPQLFPIIIDNHDAGAHHHVQTIAGISLTQQSALQLARDLVHAGAVMHSLGLVHRDLKP